MTEELKNKLIDAAREYIKDEEDIERLSSAIDFAMEGYNGVKAYDGSDYVNHVLRTSLILTELHSDITAIISELLQWLVTYNDNIAVSDIEEKFGE